MYMWGLYMYMWGLVHVYGHLYMYMWSLYIYITCVRGVYMYLWGYCIIYVGSCMCTCGFLFVWGLYMVLYVDISCEFYCGLVCHVRGLW